MKKFIKYSLLGLLLSTGTYAQFLGPVSPCVDCENFTKRTEPFNGMWYNPEQSGTGFGIDVQNGILFGAYYGYDEQGKQIWLTFVGDLKPSDTPNIMWTFDADLTQFENGNSFNNEYTSPNTTDYTSKIRIKFTQKNHAIYSVNNGDEQNIVPIIFGMPVSEDFPEQTSYKFPELEGVWTFVYHFKSSNGDNSIPFVPVEPFSIRSEVVVIDKKYSFIDYDNDGIDDIYYGVYSFFYYPESLYIGDIVCSMKPVNDELVGPDCKFIDHRGLFGDIENKPHYKMSIGGLGAFRLFGEHKDGHTLEAIKINSKHYNFFGGHDH